MEISYLIQPLITDCLPWTILFTLSTMCMQTSNNDMHACLRHEAFRIQVAISYPIIISLYHNTVVLLYCCMAIIMCCEKSACNPFLWLFITLLAGGVSSACQKSWFGYGIIPCLEPVNVCQPYDGYLIQLAVVSLIALSCSLNFIVHFQHYMHTNIQQCHTRVWSMKFLIQLHVKPFS